MAGDWVKFEHVTLTKPEVVKMSSALEIERHEVIGRLLEVWVWCDQQTIDGNALGVTDSFIDEVAGVTGFAAAMRDVGWLAGQNGNLIVPNFNRHNGKSAKSRALTAKRVKKSRNAASVTHALPEKRREEKRQQHGGADLNLKGTEAILSRMGVNGDLSKYSRVRPQELLALASEAPPAVENFPGWIVSRLALADWKTQQGLTPKILCKAVRDGFVVSLNGTLVSSAKHNSLGVHIYDGDEKVMSLTTAEIGEADIS